MTSRLGALVRAFGAIAVAYAVAALTLLLAADSPETPIARRTLEAEHIQDLALLVQADRVVPPSLGAHGRTILPLTSRSTTLETIAAPTLGCAHAHRGPRC